MRPPRLIPRLTAAAALVVAVLSHAWLVNAPRELHGGLLSFDSGGEPWTNTELVAAALANGSQHASTLFPPAGQLTFALGLLAAALLVASAFTAARWVARTTIATLGLALASGVAFVVTAPSGPAFGLSPGWSALLFVAAVVTGAAGHVRDPRSTLPHRDL